MSEPAPPAPSVERVCEPRRVKLAERIARDIEDSVLSQGWPVGHPLGREVDLAAAAGVSRWTFREAVSLLERDGLVVSRRGGGGGLFVAASTADMLCTRLGNYIAFVHATLEELTAAAHASDVLMIDQASAKLDDTTRTALHKLIAEAADPHRPQAHVATAEIRKRLILCAGNPALALLAGTLFHLVLQSAWYSALEDQPFYEVFTPMIEATRSIAIALVGDRPAEAKSCSERYVAAFNALLGVSASLGFQPLRSGSADRSYRHYPAGRPMKKAERLAREMCVIILNAGCPVGMHLGTEAELMTRFSVGRAVLREALRSLERLGVITIGRGGASGVKVAAPDQHDLVEACRHFLRRQRVSPEDAASVREGLMNARVAAGTPPGSTREGDGRFMSLMLAVLADPGEVDSAVSSLTYNR